MKSLLIVGAGSFATEVEETARLCGYDKIAFLDDDIVHARCQPVIGMLSDLRMLKDDFDEVVVAFGNNQRRMDYIHLAEQAGYKLPSLIHPTAFVSHDAKISEGCIIRTFAVVSRYASLGKGVIVNIGAKIDHDCIIGDGTHLLVGSVIRNKVTVPSLTWLDANKVIE